MMNSTSFPGSGAALESQMGDINNVRALLASYLSNRKKEAIQLLNVNGVKLLPIATDKAVQLAFLQGIKDNEAFRNQVSQILTGYVQGMPNTPIVSGKVKNKQYLNTVDEPWLGDYQTTSTTTTTPAPTTSTTSGGFWGSLKNIFTPDVIGAGIKTGLNALNTKIAADANSSSAQQALQAQQNELAILAAQQKLKETQSAGGMPTWLKVTLAGAGILTAIVVVVVIVKKSGKKAA
jgi:hypothetical protein